MKNKERDEFFIRSIFEEIEKIENFVKDTTFQTFLNDEKLQYAVYKVFENIGEASKNISMETKIKYPEIPWKEMAKFRDKLAHSYFGIDIERVWETVQKDVPIIKHGITKLIIKEEK
jgi:uncharacterized protein with HEPN domain